MKELELNLVETYPDNTWIVLYECKISGPESIDSESGVAKYIEVLIENNINYISYFSEKMSGTKHPKYTNKFRVFIKAEDLEYTQNCLAQKELLPNKSVEEIQELKDMDLDEELTYKDLPLIIRLIVYIIPMIFRVLFLWGATFACAYFSTQMKIEEGKIVVIVIAIFLGILSLLCTKRLFTDETYKKKNNRF
jgi:hypothetical protein